ncbi:glutamate receptor ionotropic, NMDA 1 isoform X2 [Manduca sexta]|uniref:glutamate receptor ionotropic, NMDA 1 isoform X2 n=1 Tax=Manduca sexta TaxID=7130 RepID=UPI0011844AB4|nr:glutamate receptor ionotropic, NMDA 1 isoform X2 [Manduca sexta]
MTLTPAQFFSPLELLLHNLVVQYLSDSYCVSVVSETPLNFVFLPSFTYINPNDTDDNNLVEKLLKVSEEGCSDYIVRFQNPQNFMNAFEKVNHLGKVRRSDRKLIFLSIPDVNYRNQALEMLSKVECSFVANILLVLTSDENQCGESFDFVTHKYVGPDSEVNEPLLLDHWNACTQQFDRKANLFPHDMTNMKGKTLKVSCFTYKPYVLLDLDPAVAPLGRDGMELRIVEEFCRWINCNVVIINEDKDQWGEIYENQTGIGIIGSVVEDRADMGITALYSWYEEWQAMDFSISCIRTAITCLAPAPRILASWEMPLLPFSKLMWLAVVITFIYAAIGLLMAQKWSSNKALLIVFGILISQSQHKIGDSWRVRSVIGWLLVAGMILVNAYGAGLASTFTVPKYESSIDTVQDIVDRNMEWGATHDAWIFSLTLSPEPLVKKLVSQFRIHSFEELKKKSFTRSMAFSIEKLPAGEYITKDAVLDMQLMLEDFYYEQCVIMMRKSSPYTEKISQLVGRLHESGLMLAWETQVALKYLDYKVQVEVKLSRSKNDVSVTEALNIKLVEGVFILYLIGVISAVILFIGEVLMEYYKSRVHAVIEI